MQVVKPTSLLYRRIYQSCIVRYPSFQRCKFSDNAKSNIPIEEITQEEHEKRVEGKHKITLQTESLPDDAPEDENLHGWINKLNDRSIIGIRGEDASKFLQSIMTLDMKVMDENPNHRALYGLFLNPKGRIIADGFVYKPYLAGQHGDMMEYWLDIETKVKDELVKHLRTYIMRK